MPPKRTKSGGGSAGVQRWEQGLLTAAFCEEDKWNASIAFVIGNKLNDYDHINTLGGAITTGLRRLFSFLSKEDLFAQVNDLGNPKNKKAKEVPQFSEICEPCKAYLDNDEDIPLPLLARLIKFRLIDIKAKDLKRREAEKKAAAEKDKPKKGGDKKDRSKSPVKGKAGKKTPEPPSAKNESKLRKRGEEDTDSKYIDDEPDDGPQHYVIITGFHDPHLISFMNELGLNVDCLIRFASDEYPEVEAVESPDQAKTSPPQPPAPEKLDGGAVQDPDAPPKESEPEKLERFWRDILQLLRAGSDESQLHNVARLDYTVTVKNIPENLQDPDIKLEFGTSLFEDIACMIYDLYDAKRRWQTYLNALPLIKIPTDFSPGPAVTVAPEASQRSATPAAPTAPSAVPPAEGGESLTGADTDMRYYHELVNQIPNESISVPLIVHCMLEQVVAWEEDKTLPSEIQKPARTDGLSDELASHISKVAFSLGLSEEEQEILSSDFDMPQKGSAGRNQPQLMEYHDEIRNRLHHLSPTEVLDPIQAEIHMLSIQPTNELCYMKTPSSKLAQERASRLQELMTFASVGGLTEFDIDHSMKQFVFESFPLSDVDDETGRVQKAGDAPVIPWDDPYPFYKGMMTQTPTESDEVFTPPIEPKEQEVTNNNVTDPNILQERLEALKSEEEKKLQGKLSGGKSNKKSGKKARSRSRSRSRPSSGKKSSSPAPAPETQNLETSRPGSAGGILKSPGSRQNSSRKSSVHFDNEGQPIELSQEIVEGDAGTPSASMTEPREPINAQRANLDHFCFVENMDRKVLLQVLNEAKYTHPIMDTYYHKRDHSLFIALHNPYNNKLCNQETWQNNLHSNVGFRNYLEHVEDSITEWSKREEAKYQASLLADEVDQIQKEADEAASRPGSSKKKGRAKSPKKSPGRKTPSRSSSAERPQSSNPYVRAGSLKAQKEEMDRIRAEEEEKERLKAEKRAKSAERKRQKEEAAAAEAEKKGRHGSRSSSKSRASKEDRPDSAAQADETPAPAEEQPPFIGYDVGNKIIHASGTLSTLFPADGAQIKTEKIEFVQGTVSVRSVLVKDGHVFGVHILDPKEMTETGAEEKQIKIEEEGHEKADIEKSEKQENELDDQIEKRKVPVVGAYGSFTAQFKDGMSISLSTYGPSGEPTGGKKYEPEPYVLPTLPRSPSPGPPKDAPSKKGKGKSGPSPAPSSHGDEAAKLEDIKDDIALIDQPFQQLFLTCPDGLSINYSLESSIGIQPDSEEDRNLLVKQSYPFKTSCQQECEDTRRVAMMEMSRVINKDGTVVKTMMDGSTQVLYGDGTVSILGPVPGQATSRLSSPERSGSGKSGKGRDSPKKNKSRRSAKDKEVVSEPVEEDPLTKSQWTTTLPSGERICTRLDGQKQEVKDVLICAASDPQTVESMHTRDDGVIIIQQSEGSTIVEHADGTRITTIYADSLPDAVNDQQMSTQQCNLTVQTEGANVETASIENENVESAEEMASQKKRKIAEVIVECAGYAAIKFHPASGGGCSTELGSGTSLYTYPDGNYDVYYHDNTCLQIDAEGTVSYIPRPNPNLEMHDPKQHLQYVIRHFDPVLIETVDNEGNHYHVTNTGESIMILKDCVNKESKNVENKEGDVKNEEEEKLEDGKREKIEEDADKVDDDDANKVVENLEEGETSEQKYVKEEEALETTEEKTDSCKKESEVIKYKQQAPRFFIMNADGSGMELLRYQDIAEYFSTAENDAATAVLIDSLPDYPTVSGITIMRPYFKDVSNQWVKPYALDTIIPEGLTSRDLKTLPSKEQKKPGPKFGTNVGQGLMVGSLQQPTPQMPQLQCPDTLQVRHLIQYRPISEELRKQLIDNVQLYAQYVCDRKDMTEAIQVFDPRSSEEKILAEDIEGHAVADASKKQSITTQQTHSYPVSDKHSPINAPQVERVTTPLAEHIKTNAREVYESATAQPEPSPPPTPICKRTKADWEWEAREKREEQENLRLLREKDIPPYFSSELGKAFLLSQAPDMEALAAELAQRPPRSGSSSTRSAISNIPDQNPAQRGETNSIGTPETSALPNTTTPVIPPPSSAEHSHIDTPADPLHPPEVIPSPYIQNTGDTPPTLRPGNPTPGHATGQGSPAPVRPNNPTPANAMKTIPSDRPGAPTPKEAGGQTEESSREQLSEGKDNLPEEDIQEETVEMLNTINDSHKSPPDVIEGVPTTENGDCPHSTGHLFSSSALHTNVVGLPREESVRIPAYMSKSGRPGALPNQRYNLIEDPVRRHTHISSISGATFQGAHVLASMRGFQLLPNQVDFGVVKEGYTYNFIVCLKNTGVDACRFKLAQPPPSTGLRVIYQPGPVAAGLTAKLELELFAIAAGVEGESGIGQIRHDLEIVTETDHLYLPISATVMTSYEYEHSPAVNQQQLAPGVKCVSTRPRSTHGIIRPRKENTLRQVLVK